MSSHGASRFGYAATMISAVYRRSLRERTYDRRAIDDLAPESLTCGSVKRVKQGGKSLKADCHRNPDLPHRNANLPRGVRCSMTQSGYDDDG